MVGFAPYDDPQIAVSIVLTQGSSSYNASPIMRDIVGKYFDLNVNISNDDVTKEDLNTAEFGTNWEENKTEKPENEGSATTNSMDDTDIKTTEDNESNENQIDINQDVENEGL